MAVMVTDNYPSNAKLDDQYEWKIDQARTADAHDGDRRDLRKYFDSARPPTPSEVKARELEASKWYANELSELPDKQRRYLTDAAPYTLLPFGVYLFCLLLVIVVKWIIRGFRTASN